MLRHENASHHHHHYLSLSLSNFSNQHEEPCAFVGMSWFYVGVENENTCSDLRALPKNKEKKLI